VALVGVPIALVGVPIALVGRPVALVGFLVALVSHPVALVGFKVALVGFPVAFVGFLFALICGPVTLETAGAKDVFSFVLTLFALGRGQVALVCPRFSRFQIEFPLVGPMFATCGRILVARWRVHATTIPPPARSG
jgi:hypothetical protein